MKLTDLHESGPDERSIMHHRLTMQNLSDQEKQIIFIWLVKKITAILKKQNTMILKRLYEQGTT